MIGQKMDQSFKNINTIKLDEEKEMEIDNQNDSILNVSKEFDNQFVNDYGMM